MLIENPVGGGVSVSATGFVGTGTAIVTENPVGGGVSVSATGFVGTGTATVIGAMFEAKEGARVGAGKLASPPSIEISEDSSFDLLLLLDFDDVDSVLLLDFDGDLDSSVLLLDLDGDFDSFLLLDLDGDSDSFFSSELSLFDSGFELSDPDEAPDEEPLPLLLFPFEPLLGL
jgi:hypothetical protein